MQPTALIAIGGNSLLRAGEPATVQLERAHVADVAGAVAEIVAHGWRVVLTHGNGPQVGAELLRSEYAAREAYPLPLDVCVACTQGEIGFLLQQGMTMALAARGIARPAVTLLTQVVVAANDPAFSRPTKPIGPYYTPEVAEARRAAGWSLVEVPSRGFRRVVASPEPQQIVEQDVIRTLLDAGGVVIALGGGGIPVVRTGGELKGVEAVIDKDLASAVLAARLDVDLFVIATDVDRIYLDFGRPEARGLDVVRTADLRRYAAAGMFPPGSMGPKVEAALRFIEGGGREAIVTSHDTLVDAVGGRGGTHILPGVADRTDAPDSTFSRAEALPHVPVTSTSRAEALPHVPVRFSRAEALPHVLTRTCSPSERQDPELQELGSAGLRTARRRTRRTTSWRTP